MSLNEVTKSTSSYDGGLALPQEEQMSSADLATRILVLADELDQAEASTFSQSALQALFSAIISLNARKFDAGQRDLPLAADKQPSATAVLVTTSALLKASNLQVFELGMWQSWSGTI